MSFTGSSVVISGISIFEAARTINPKKNCTITFDAHLWFGAGYDTIAALSFYNEDGKSFPNDEVKKYFITANVRVSLCSIVLINNGCAQVAMAPQVPEAIPADFNYTSDSVFTVTEFSLIGDVISVSFLLLVNDWCSLIAHFGKRWCLQVAILLPTHIIAPTFTSQVL